MEDLWKCTFRYTTNLELEGERNEKKMAELRKMWAVVVGYGNRGQVYADYALQEPEEFGIAAIVDPNEFKLQEAKVRYGLTDDRLFQDFDAFAKSGIACDFVINATMDQLHYETAMQILNAGYDMLMEKPIVANARELKEIEQLAKEKEAMVFVCHVLRYTPFYRKIKELLNAGAIGVVETMEMNEHVCLSHFVSSYVRGKWNSEKECGSGFILAKSCHDMDLMCWLNNASAPEKVASFGHRAKFIPENAPEGAAEFCYQCEHEKTCPYSAIDQYIDKDVAPFLVWDRLNKPLDEISMEEKQEFIKHDIYGKCVYTCGGDIVDRQNAIVTFANGSVATFNLVGGTMKPGRYLHIVGNLGEIEGLLEDDKFILRTYDKNERFGKVEEIEVHPINKAKFGGHSGGDYMIMYDLIRYLNGDKSSVSITSIEDSVNGHMCIFSAEESRKTGNVVSIE